ncbi:hypothetical protein B0T25DRAFT_318888 [Lasiosphaeria hispida]|uniref:Uncharacterized protein n=1 Tax=Lasiosphaeria hispida TaxID=260671 RepID=A0AAJ0H983_9PEZI|nr:hypothetical protein B0T25DRAFT_318888 [Lasiosphaeria hispida]
MSFLSPFWCPYLVEHERARVRVFTAGVIYLEKRRFGWDLFVLRHEMKGGYGHEKVGRKYCDVSRQVDGGRRRRGAGGNCSIGAACWPTWRLFFCAGVGCVGWSCGCFCKSNVFSRLILYWLGWVGSGIFSRVSDGLTMAKGNVLASMLVPCQWFNGGERPHGSQRAPQLAAIGLAMLRVNTVLRSVWTSVRHCNSPPVEWMVASGRIS